MASITPDTERDESAWAQALAGHPPEGMDPAIKRQAELLRAGLQRRKARIDADIEAPNEANFQRLLFRLQKEGLNDQRRRDRFVNRTSFTWGMAASLVLAFVLVFELQHSNHDGMPDTGEQSLMRGEEDVTIFMVSDPVAFKEKISVALLNTDATADYSTNKDGSITIKVRATQNSIDALAELNLYPTLKNGYFTIVLRVK